MTGLSSFAGRLLPVLFLLPVALPCSAALPFTVKTGQHPRVLMDAARINTIRAEALTDLPLYGARFPQTGGSVVFDIYPVARTDSNQSELLSVFDAYNRDRNHIFIRHYDSVNPSTGLTYCGTDPADPSVLCMQLALQPVATAYIASKNFRLNVGQWQTLRISWNSVTHSASYQVDNQPSVSLGWRKDGNNNPLDWVVDGQRFLFTGRDRLDNIRVYDTDDPASGQLLADFPMNDAAGVRVTDVSGNNLSAEISGAVAWGVRSATDPDPVIEPDGYTGSFSTVSASVLYYAWEDFYKSAASVAAQIIAGSSVVDVAAGHPNGIINVARQLGLGYLVTGEADFVTAALIYADRLIAVTPASSGGDYTQAGRVEAMGTLYDWLYGTLTTTTHAGSGLSYAEALVTAIKNTLIPLERFICGSGKTLTAGWSCSALPATPPSLGGHSHQNNTEVTAALLAVIDEHPEFEPLLDIEYRNFTNRYNPLREWVSIDGGHHMGWSYGGTYTFLDSIQLWNTATLDVDMTAPWQGKLVDRYIYGLRGDLRFPASGDTFYYDALNEQLVAFALWGSRYSGNTYAQNFYNRQIEPGKKGSRFSELLYWQPGLPGTAIETLDYSRHFRNAGQVVMRDSWDYPNATLLEFKSTSFSSVNHHHYDQNAFTLFYKSPLLVDSGDYDRYGTEHWHNYYTRSIAHNTLTVFDPTEVFNRNPAVFCCSNDGGQQFMPGPDPELAAIQPGGSHHLDGVTAYEYAGDYTYVRGNASKAYNAAKLDQSNGFLRDIVYLRQPGFWSRPLTLVFDKVTAATGRGDLDKRLLFHTVNEPEPAGGQQIAPGQYRVAGDTVTVRNGAGMLFVQTLLPENPVITKTGGRNGAADYRFLVPVDDGNGGYQLTNFPPSPDPGTGNTDMGAWRFEISAPLPAQREYFLNILSVADNSPSLSPPAAVSLSSASAAVALLGNSRLVAFNKLDDPGATLDWNVPALNISTLVTGLLPGANYSVAVAHNAAPATDYHVTVCQDAGGAVSTSSAGTFALQSALTLTPDLDGDSVGDTCDTDIDGDGLSNAAEVLLGTDPLNADTDGDLLGDGEEVSLYLTDPLQSDTDNDGYRDGTEVANASDPLDPQSLPVLVANGDVSLDGRLDVADILLAQRHLLGLVTLTAEQRAYGDLYPASGDGLITASDLLLINRQVLQLP